MSTKTTADRLERVKKLKEEIEQERKLALLTLPAELGYSSVDELIDALAQAQRTSVAQPVAAPAVQPAVPAEVKAPKAPKAPKAGKKRRRAKITEEIRVLIRRLAQENQVWGAPNQRSTVNCRSSVWSFRLAQRSPAGF